MHETPQPPNDAPVTPEPGIPAESGGLSRRTKAWLGMGAVAAALVLLTLASEQSTYDPNAPPPAAGLGDGEEISDGGLAVGADAPLSYTLKDMNGVDVSLASFKGKVILLNFWATWCGPCRVEIPYLIELQKEYAEDLVILGVSVDDTPEKLRPYAADMQINYPLLIGNGRQDFQDAYGPFWGIPVSVFVNREGKIHLKHSGIASKEQFEREIMAAL